MAIKVDNKFTIDGKLSPFTSVGLCSILSMLYVVSLYVWKREYKRDHPITVKRRFCSVGVVTFISLGFVYFFSNPTILKQATYFGILGLRISGLIPAIAVGLFLTATLFAGPLYVEFLDGHTSIYLSKLYWLSGCKDILWLRNHIMAPLTEELTFRACIMALLMQSFPPKTVVLITPFFFSIAHYHHIFELKSIGVTFKVALIMSTFQFVYTTIFGYYSAYLFARTGHFAASLIAHCFCNHMGFPDIQKVAEYQGIQKLIILGFYVSGVSAWFVLLPYVTTPDWYDNKLYWKG